MVSVILNVMHLNIWSKIILVTYMETFHVFLPPLEYPHAHYLGVQLSGKLHEVKFWEYTMDLDRGALALHIEVALWNNVESGCPGHNPHNNQGCIYYASLKPFLHLCIQDVSDLVLKSTVRSLDILILMSSSKEKVLAKWWIRRSEFLQIERINVRSGI